MANWTIQFSFIENDAVVEETTITVESLGGAKGEPGADAVLPVNLALTDTANIFEEKNNFKDISSIYDYSTGEKAVAQMGGVGLGDYLGLPANAVKGHLKDFLNAPKYPNLRVLEMFGNFLNAGSQKDMGSTYGTFRLDGAGYASLFTHPLFTGLTQAKNEADFEAKFKAINTSLDHAHLHVKTKGWDTEAIPIDGYSEEALVELHSSNSEGEKTKVYISPHNIFLGNLLKLSDGYKNGTFVKGYLHSDTFLKTGTNQTVLGDPVKNLGIDSDGNVILTDSIISDNVVYNNIINTFLASIFVDGTVKAINGGQLIAENTTGGANMIVNVTDGATASLKAGTGQQQFKFDENFLFAIAKDTKANILLGAGAGVNLLTIDPITGNVGIGIIVAGSEKLEVNGKIKATDINFTGLPTSSSGLVAGDVWNDAGTLKII